MPLEFSKIFEQVRTELRAEMEQEARDALREQVDICFTARHSKVEHAAKNREIRDKAKELALLIVNLAPLTNIRELSMSLNSLEEVVYWAQACILREEAA